MSLEYNKTMEQIQRYNKEVLNFVKPIRLCNTLKFKSPKC